jgi:hypothetical protein
VTTPDAFVNVTNNNRRNMTLKLVIASHAAKFQTMIEGRSQFEATIKTEQAFVQFMRTPAAIW